MNMMLWLLNWLGLKRNFEIQLKWNLVDTPFAGHQIPLKNEVIDWLFNNCKGSYSTRICYKDNYPSTAFYIKFTKREDMLAFKLKWY